MSDDKVRIQQALIAGPADVPLAVEPDPFGGRSKLFPAAITGDFAGMMQAPRNGRAAFWHFGRQHIDTPFDVRMEQTLPKICKIRALPHCAVFME